MNASRYLVRVFPGGIAKWIEAETDPETLAKVFNLADSEQSVYEVADGAEEWLAAAAHKLTDPHRSPDAVSVLRMGREELRHFGIRVDEDVWHNRRAALGPSAPEPRGEPEPTD